jgi:hypothetical protein
VFARPFPWSINDALDIDDVTDVAVPAALLVTRTAFGRVCLLTFTNRSMPTSLVVESAC